MTVPLHLSIPRGRHVAGDPVPLRRPPPARPARPPRRLYAVIVALTTFLNTGMSAHMIGILAGLGVTASAAVGSRRCAVSASSTARLAEVLLGARVHPLALGVFAASLLPICFVAGLGAGRSPAGGAAFALLFGAGNGLLTIVRGTAPLVLFQHQAYGAVVGRLLVPSFFLLGAGPARLRAGHRGMGSARRPGAVDRDRRAGLGGIGGAGPAWTARPVARRSTRAVSSVPACKKRPAVRSRRPTSSALSSIAT